MAVTLIASSSLTTTASSVTFSSISSAYKDLWIQMSVRSNFSNDNSSISLVTNISGTYYYTFWRAYQTNNGTGFSSYTDWSGILYNPANSAVADAYSNQTIYLPSYTDTRFTKIGSHNSAMGNNSGNIWIAGGFANFPGNSAITSITLGEANAAQFVAGSTFNLYGIS
jgi:hypothetical protein